MSEEGVSEFVKKEEAEIFIRFKITDGFWRAEEKFATRFEGEVGVGGLESVEEGKIGAREK